MKIVRAAAILLIMLMAPVASMGASVVLKDNFTGGSASLSWIALNGACLTAGNGTGSIPACNGLAYYGTQTQVGLTNNTDPTGSGALRFTNGYPYYHENGGVILNTPFPSDQGVQVTFTTYTYGGDNSGGHGADGIGFYILNGTQAPNLGSWGGSLGYSCSNSNSPYNGMMGAYLGLGIDEYGNFLNQSDNTATGFGYQPGRIGIRGYGNVNLTSLQAINPSATSSNVQSVCKYGGSYTYHGTTYTLPDYAAIPNAYKVMPSNQPIANEAATKRTQATPITYSLKITSAGLLSFGYYYNGGAYQSVVTNQDISAYNGPMPSSFLFGFGGSTGGSDNVHEITCFTASSIGSASSVGVNAIQSGQVKTSTQVYIAYYHSDDWWGQMLSQSLVTSGGNLTVSSIANWDANCVLTGGGCPAMGTDAQGNPLHSITLEPYTSRQILTWSGTAGIPFQTETSLPSAMQSALDSMASSISSTVTGQNILNWLLGDRSNEQTTGSLRKRIGVLGDIIDSSPTFVGAPANVYPVTWSDALNGSAATLPENGSGAQTYPAFQSKFATRLNVVYDGANDGILHGFRTGNYNADGSYNSTYNDGYEVLGYLPATLLLSNAPGLANPGYAHSYFVDATPGAGDLFYGSQWHTWLAGGLGQGGAAIYALDITDPTTFSLTNAAALVMGEWTSSTLSCTNSSTCGANLGNTWGTPLIRRLHNGQWAMIFGNGFGSATGHAGVFIGLVNSSTGALNFLWLDTGTGSSSSPDGIAYVSSADLDGDHITDYLYAGDLQGNVWRFDLTNINPSDWGVSKFGNSTATPLYTAKDGSGNVQPITTKLSVDATMINGMDRVMVTFGTGKKTLATAVTPDSYAGGTQSLYGIWDWDMSAWNTGVSVNGSTSPSSGGVPPSSMQYASLSVPPSTSLSRSNLQVQTVTSSTATTSSGQVLGYRTTSSNNICWIGTLTCSTSNDQYGWYLDLPTSGEQVIYNPISNSGAFIVNTTIPPSASNSQCSPSTTTGWTMAFNIQTGGNFAQGFFPGSDGTYNTASGSSPINGIQMNAIGSGSIVNVGNSPYDVAQTPNGVAVVTGINPQSGIIARRVTWTELR